MADFFARNQPYIASGPKSVRQASPTYNAPLSPLEEMAFRQWLEQNNVPFNPDAPVADYDMRGFWRALQSGDPRASSSVNPNDGRLHYPDVWKTPHHETFSNESQWAVPNAPTWNERDQLVSPGGRILKDERAPPEPAQPLTRLRLMSAVNDPQTVPQIEPQSSMQGRQLIPNDFDQMVVPPYTLPPDRNTFSPEDVMQHRVGGRPKLEDI